MTSAQSHGVCENGYASALHSVLVVGSEMALKVAGGESGWRRVGSDSLAGYGNAHASKNGGVEIRSISWPIYQMHVYRSFVPDEFRTGLTRDQ